MILNENFIKKILKLLKKIGKKSRYLNKNPDYSKYKIGKYTYGYPKIMNWNEGAKLEIGSFCSIADEVVIFLGGNHRNDWITTFPFNVLFENYKYIKGHPATKGDVIIGNDVWIGYGATILSGVHIGDGAVIGARSVVSRNVEPYSIVIGNPAKEVKKRFDPETIEELLKLKWWNWEINKIKDNIELLQSNKIIEFIEKNNIEK